MDPERSADRRRAPPRPRQRRERSRTIEYLRGWAANDELAEYLETHQTRLVKTLEITPPGGPGDRVLEMGAYLQITPALRTQARLRRGARLLLRQAGPHATIATVTSAEGETFAVRHRSLRRREGPVSLSRRALLDRALLRTDRAPVRGPDAPDARGEPHPEAGRPPGADHAEHRGAARHLGDPAGLPSRILPRLHPAGGIAARWTRGTIANTRRARFTSLLENSGFEVTLLETGEFRDEPHPEFGWVHAPAGALPPRAPNCAATGSTPWAERPGAVRERYPALALLMSAAYLEPDVGSTRARARCTPRSRSATIRARPGAPREGFGVGYHLFDADTGTLIVDGARVHPERDVKPGETAPVRAGDSSCRAEDGRYQVLRLADARERLLVLRAGLAVPAGRDVDANGAAQRGPRARRHRRTLGASALCAPSGARFVYPVLDHLAQSRPDPRDGAARHSGALSRVVSAARSGPSSIRCC